MSSFSPNQSLKCWRLRQTDQELRPEDIITQYMVDPSALTESGTASGFSPITSVGINFDLLNGNLYFDLADAAMLARRSR
jgi:hypothetical protein